MRIASRASVSGRLASFLKTLRAAQGLMTKAFTRLKIMAREAPMGMGRM